MSCQCEEAVKNNWCWEYFIEWENETTPNRILCGKCGKDLTNIKINNNVLNKEQE